MSNRAPLSLLFRFPPYVFDPETGELRRNGVRLRLEPQPARVLCLLLEKQGRLVTRGELIASLWPGEVEGEFDRRLDKAIAKLRVTLHDDPVQPRFIETLKGRGYRFLVPVESEAKELRQEAQPAPASLTAHDSDLGPVISAPFPEQPDPPPPSPMPEATPAAGWRIPHWLPYAAVGVSLIALILLVGSLAGLAHSRRSPGSGQPPLLLMTGFAATSAADSWMERSISGWLASDLAATGDLAVVRPAQQLRIGSNLQSCGVPAQQVLKALLAAYPPDYLVYGSYASSAEQPIGPEWKLQICLLDVRNPKHPSMFTVAGDHEEIAHLVVQAGTLLRAQLGMRPRSAQSLGYLRAALPSNMDAARLYAEATLALEQFDPQEAAALLTQAAEIEPAHAPTHAALATAWARLGHVQRAQAEAARAQALAGTLSPLQQEEFAALVHETTENWPEAVSSYDALLRALPDSIPYAVKLADALTRTGHASAALDSLRSFRSRYPRAGTDPNVDLAEAGADGALSDFRAQLAAALRAEVDARRESLELLVADAQMQQGAAEDSLGNWNAAMRLWQQASETYDSIGDRGGVADALNSQAQLAIQRGDLSGAVRFFSQSMAISRAMGDQGLLAYSLARLGLVRMQLAAGEDENALQARAMFHEAARIYETNGNPAEQGYVLSLLGDDAVRRDSFEEARRLYQQALGLSQAAHDRSRIAGRLMDLGIVAQAQGSPADAEGYLTQAAAEFDAIGQQDMVAIAHARLADELYQTGELDRAAAMLNDSMARLKAIGRAHQVCEVTGDLTRVELLRNPSHAEALAEDDIRNCASRTEYHGGTVFYAQLAQAQAELGRLADAANNIHRALSKTGLRRGSLDFDLFMADARVKLALGDNAGASQAYGEINRFARQHQAAFWDLESRLGLAEVQLYRSPRNGMAQLQRVRLEAARRGLGLIGLEADRFAAGTATQPARNRS